MLISKIKNYIGIAGIVAIFFLMSISFGQTVFTPRQISYPTSTPVKGQVYVVSSSAQTARVGVGSDGRCLTASSTATYGISWEPCVSSSSTININTFATGTFTFNGTTNQVTITQSPSGTLTWSLPQSIDTGATLQFFKLGLGVSPSASSSFITLNSLINTGNIAQVWVRGTTQSNNGGVASGIIINSSLGVNGSSNPTSSILSGLYIESSTAVNNPTGTKETAQIYVNGPINGTTTIGNYAIHVASGTTRLDGPVTASNTLSVGGNFNVTGTANFAASATIPFAVDGSGNKYVTSTGSGLKLPAITVASSGADFADLPSAVSACANTTNYPNGANIYLADRTYTITTTQRLAAGCNIIGNYHYTNISFTATTTGGSNAPGSTLFSASGTIPGHIGLTNLILNQASSGYHGTALDMSNMNLLRVNNVQSLGFRYGIYANDTNNGTFYNQISNWSSFDDNCIYASSTNPVNDNEFENIRCAMNSSNTTSTKKYGLYLNNGQVNNFYNLNVEPSTSTNVTGIALVSSGARSNSFFGTYAEANATSVDIGTGAIDNAFIGGQVCCHISASIVDAGSRTFFYGLNDNFTGLGTSTIPAPFLLKDFSANSVTNTITNNNSFAHVNSRLVDISLVNGTDSSTALRVKTAGTGPALDISGGTVRATGTVATVSACGSSPSILGTWAGLVTTGNNASSTCTVNFPVKFQNPPVCTVTSNTTSSIGYKVAVTTSTAVISTASSSAFISNQLSYICIGL